MFWLWGGEGRLLLPEGLRSVVGCSEEGDPSIAAAVAPGGYPPAAAAVYGHRILP